MQKSVEDEIFENLLKCGVDFEALRSGGFPMGAAVSGGADSICLLFALSHICTRERVPLKVITVNHKIRTAEESEGDARAVENVCKGLCEAGCDVECFLYALGDGEVYKTAEKRKKGIEDAARFLRYNAFEDFARRSGVAFLCLAHNRDDNVETILMRFLQGGDVSSLRGIRGRRGIFLRPMLSVSRRKIEEYLIERKISWRTDKTNFDESYFRNRIRHSLIPLLDEKFPGWRQGVLAAALKCGDDDDALEELRAVCCEGEKMPDGGVCFSRDSISTLSRAVLSRVIFKAISEVVGETRFPYIHIRSVLDAIRSNERNFLIEAAGIQISLDENNLFVKLRQNIATDSCFFAIIEEGGTYTFPFGDVFVQTNGNSADVFIKERIFHHIPVPFCIRNRQADDYVKTADGGRKNVADFLSSLHIQNSLRDAVPVIQELSSKEQEIVVVATSVMGYKDWVCKN